MEERENKESSAVAKAAFNALFVGSGVGMLADGITLVPKEPFISFRNFTDELMAKIGLIPMHSPFFITGLTAAAVVFAGSMAYYNSQEQNQDKGSSPSYTPSSFVAKELQKKESSTMTTLER